MLISLFKFMKIHSKFMQNSSFDLPIYPKIHEIHEIHVKI